MDTTKVYRERVLAAIEQALIAGLPTGWRDLEAPRSREREAAAVLLRLAEHDALAEMQQTAIEAAATAAERRHDPMAGEERFWEGLKDLLARIGEGRQGGPRSVADLALWGEGPVRSLVDGVDHAFGGPAAGSGALDEETLTAVARLVLRACARRWLIEARKADQRPPDEAREEAAP